MKTEQPLSYTERLTFAQKNKNGQQWYREYADRLDSQHYQIGYGYGDISEFKRMKVNYDLFNDKIDLGDFSYVCQPFGANVGELPARMVNRDIVSGKIKAMIGMEMKRPFSWTVLATNPEATTRKEQKESELYREFTVNYITQPIRQQIEQQMAQELQGRELTPEEQQQIQQQVEEQMKAMTPDEVKKYMQREHQDPAEVLANQLLQYFLQKLDIKNKFEQMFKHGLLSGLGVMYVSVLNGEPVAWNVNSMRFACEKSPDTYFIEDAENATCEYRMTPSEVIKYFGDELTDKQIDKIYSRNNTTGSKKIEHWLANDSDSMDNDMFDINDVTSIRVLHCVWKSLRKIGFLQYQDEAGELQERMVDESYKLDPSIGDLSIEWEWIPECYETWKIEDDIYVNMRPIPGQLKDINNAYNCKLPYYGVIYDNLNSKRVSLMDRIKSYQYFYNIIMYRLELLLASDKGKKILMNINMIPDSAGMDMKKWQYFFESTPFMWYDPNEEGSQYTDANTVAKAIDMSLVSDIQKYIEIAEYIRTQCGRSVGITDQVEGQISPAEAVTNTRQNLVQSSYILEPYFAFHSLAKRNFLQALIEACKVAYSGRKSMKLSYILDDMSQQILELDTELLDSSTYGVFVTDSAKAEEAKELIRQLAHAALQNQKVELSDVISVIRQEGIVEAEETLKAAEQTRREFEQQIQQQEQEAQQQMEQAKHEFAKKEHDWRLEEIVVKEEERRKTVIAQASITGASFNPEADANNNGMNDFLELANDQIELNLKQQGLDIERDKLSHQKDIDNKKIEVEKEKNKIAKQKNNSPRK